VKKNIIITPTFNDWKSLNKLIVEIDKNIKSNKKKFKIIIINDCSTVQESFELTKLKKIKEIYVLNLKKNVGSQKAIYIGLMYLKNKKDNSIITIIDSDGEDDPKKIPSMISMAGKYPKHVITANRKKRTEKIFYRFLNHVRLIITFCLTGKYIDFGNFTSFDSKNLKKILINSNLSLAYSAGILSNIKNIKRFNAEKRKRYFGDSKVGLKFLIEHSFNIISVFKKSVFIRSLFLILISFNFINHKLLLIITVSSLIIFNLLILGNNIMNNKNSKYKKMARSLKKIKV
jgi:polyisoprenyl-phosphate glycosyltransferase